MIAASFSRKCKLKRDARIERRIYLYVGHILSCVGIAMQKHFMQLLHIGSSSMHAGAINPFLLNDSIWRHETFSFIMSLPAMPFGDSARAERVGHGEVGDYTHWVQTAWPCLGSAVERPWVHTGWPISVLFGINGLRSKLSHFE